ncbi:MAG: hypothetical protein HYZ50_21805 [Deltaproteobacteria bacterium]|nr:hypothetical protein [Deltaproteobacteria bacterium]
MSDLLKLRLGKNWRSFVASIACGLGAGLFAVAIIASQLQAEARLLVQNVWFLSGILFFLSALLCVSGPPAVDFWRRYRRTRQLSQPPILYIELFTVGVICSVATITFFQGDVLYRWWFAHTYETTRDAGVLALIFVSGWLLITWVWSLRKEARDDFSENAESGSTAYFDNAIVADKQDLLGRVPFVDGLYRQIAELPSSESFVFGLHGSWGEGKTSALNLLRSRLARNSAIILIVFNPWYMTTETAIIQNFYDVIEQALRKRYLVGTLRRFLSRYRGLLSSGLRSIGFGIELPIHDDPEDLRRELEGWIARTGCHLVIIIDDIDRLQPAEVLAVFKLAGLSARLQHTVFVLSFDEIVIRERLRETIQVDPAFLEKIVQKPLSLPPAEQRDINRFLLSSDEGGLGSYRSAIDRLLDDLGVDPQRRKEFDERIVSFYESRLVRLFRTLRQAKRYLNSLRAALPPIANEVNLYDFFLLEALQIFFPEVYQDIWRNRWFYLSGWGNEALAQPLPFNPLGDKEERARLIREHITDLLAKEPEKGVAQAILEEIFPLEVAPAFNSRPVMYSGGSRDARREKRLTHPECFPKYFLFRIPAGEMADDDVELILRRWNELPEQEVAIDIEEKLKTYQQAGLLARLFERLRVFRQELRRTRVPMLIRVLYRNTQHFSRPKGLEEAEYNRAERLIWELLKELPEAVEARALLEEIVREAESVHFVAGMLESCQDGSADSFLPVNERAVIRQIVSDRLYQRFVRESRDVFTELPGDDWGYVLYQWGTDWMSGSDKNRVTVQSYLRTLLPQRIEYVGKILLRFFSPFRSSTFRWEDFCRVYDPELFVELLERYGSAECSDEKAREAVERFQQAYAEKRNLQKANPGETSPPDA